MALQIGKTYYIKNVALNKYLNIYGNEVVSNGRNVNLYDKEDVMAQKWIVQLRGNGAVVLSALDTAYGLNINTGDNNNCTIWPVASNTDADCVVDFLTVDASQNLYRIKILGYNRYLALYDVSSANVYWSSINDDYALWQLEEVTSSGTTTPVISTNAPTELKDKTFFVKNYNTGYNLNVHGYDTVENERNVNVYTKENCLAQKWIVRQESDGAKLFTAINSNFALNINTGTNNCSMYNEATNASADSVLEFIPYTTSTITADDKVYRIKMANHNKYLDVESTGNSANAYWVSDTSGYSLWQFVTEEIMFPDIPSSPKVDATLANMTVAVKVDGTDFNLNVLGTDTISDGRNVNIYSKEDCNAQRWFIANTVNGAKLYSILGEDVGYALNIDASNNCTMKQASSNDMNSLLEFEFIGFMKCRIKMFNHNKYLAVEGTAASGANVRWVDGIGNATIWKIVPAGSDFPNITNRRVFLENFYDLFEIVLKDTFSTKNAFVDFATYEEVELIGVDIETNKLNAKVSLNVRPQFIDNSDLSSVFTLEQEYNGTTNPVSVVWGNELISVSAPIEEIIGDNFSFDSMINNLAVTFGLGEYSYEVTSKAVNNVCVKVIKNMPTRPDNPEIELGFGASLDFDITFDNDSGFTIELPEIKLDLDFNKLSIIVFILLLACAWKVGTIKALIDIFTALAGTALGQTMLKPA